MVRGLAGLVVFPERGDIEQQVLCASVPVSYTHLRAHETVLDLVCRLLLEKKKKYNTHSEYKFQVQVNSLMTLLVTSSK